jgi:hypothetical protein
MFFCKLGFIVDELALKSELRDAFWQTSFIRIAVSVSNLFMGYTEMYSIGSLRKS